MKRYAPPVVTAALLLAIAGTYADEKLPLSAAPPPMQVAVSMDNGGQLVFRYAQSGFVPKEVKVVVDGKERTAFYYEAVTHEGTFRWDSKDVKVYGANGTEI